MDAFALNIRDNTAVLASGEEGLLDMQIIDAIKQSLETGKKMDITYWNHPEIIKATMQ